MYGHDKEADSTNVEIINALAAQKRRDLWEDHLLPTSDCSFVIAAKVFIRRLI